MHDITEPLGFLEEEPRRVGWEESKAHNYVRSAQQGPHGGANYMPSAQQRAHGRTQLCAAHNKEHMEVHNCVRMNE